jgi:phosphoglycolate phosphatase
VADEVRDVLACQKAKIKMIGVSWGLAKSETLKKAGADLIIKKPSEILKIIIV